jgi:LysR family transcriptional activator of glutamate synthase operon
MNMEWFHAFLEASRQKSLSKASEKLNISQPALSKQIRNLEEILGVELFKRTAQGVELTVEGALLHQRIQPILSEIESLRKDLLNLNKISSFRLGTLPSLATYYLPQKLYDIAQQGIQADVSVLSTTKEIIALLQDGIIDVGIIQKSNSIPSSYWCTDLYNEPFFVIVPRNHPLYHKQSVTLADLKEEPLIVYPNHCDVRNSIIKAYHMKGYEPNFSVEVSFGESIPGFVAAGAGITILPEIISSHLSHISLRAIPILDFVETRTISMICSKRSLFHNIRPFLDKAEIQIL